MEYELNTGPNWARALVRGGCVVIAAIAGVLWALVSILVNMTEQEQAIRILRAGLHDPMAEAIERAATDPNVGDPIVVDEDLVQFSIPRAALSQQFSAVVNDATQVRAEQLYANGFPPDPGPERTYLGLPRPLLNQFTAAEHERIESARTAATILLIAALVVCMVAGIYGLSAAVFGVPAGALLVAWVLTRLQLLLLDQWLDRSWPATLAYRAAFERITVDPPRLLLIGAIGFGVAMSTFRAVRPARGGRRRLRRRRGATAE